MKYIWKFCYFDLTTIIENQKVARYKDKKRQQTGWLDKWNREAETVE